MSEVFYYKEHRDFPDGKQSRLSQPINPVVALFVILLAGGLTLSIFHFMPVPEFVPPVMPKIVRKPPRIPEKPKLIPRPKPAKVSMKRLKRQGCVTDGILSEYNPDREGDIALINRSNCYYLHRAVETWLTPPDFETIEYVMDRIEKKDVVFGMFLAEAVDLRDEYYWPDEERNFDFRAMCHPGTDDRWGWKTCQPTLANQEYRDYLRYITRRAIDLGIQSFTFGQIYFQENGEKDWAPKLVKEMRDYAKKKKVDIVVGAQTGKITDPSYLKNFDYIEGGVGIDADGNLPDGPCLDRWGGCWPLLWHERYAKNAKNVLLHLDWSGMKSDDLDTFARMDQETRTTTLQNIYAYFIDRDMGFLMPFFGVLDPANNGCYGPKKKFYSPDNRYKCRDEDAINRIMKNGA